MELTDGICEHVADQNGSTELDNIVTPEHTTYEDIDDVLRSFIDLAAQHKRTSPFTAWHCCCIASPHKKERHCIGIGRLTVLD